MAFGLDYVTGPPIADLKAAGVTFVCRYLSEVNPLTQVKLLTKAEAETLSHAGIAIVSNYEWYATRPLEGEASGVADARIAASQHAACGGPVDRPIYFSVDVDVAGEQVAEYFKGVDSTIGLERAGGYGSERVLKYLFDNKLITWGWQTYAWSGGQWEPRAHIHQYQDGMVMSGHSVDYDRSMKDDFGQWKGGSMVPQGWHDDGTTLTAPNGHKVVHGFRIWVLAHNWDATNVPLQEEQGLTPLEGSNPPLGGGTRQLFNETMLEWTAARNVFVGYVGRELLWREGVYGQLYADRQQKMQQIAQLQAQVQQLQGQVSGQVSPQLLSDIQQIASNVEAMYPIAQRFRAIS